MPHDPRIAHESFRQQVPQVISAGDAAARFDEPVTLPATDNENVLAAASHIKLPFTLARSKGSARSRTVNRRITLFDCLAESRQSFNVIRCPCLYVLGK